MFLIGLIVGIILTVLVVGGFALVCCAATYKSWDEFLDVTDVIGTAVSNRESEIQIWHNGDLIDSMVMEEMY